MTMSREPSFVWVSMGSMGRSPRDHARTGDPQDFTIPRHRRARAVTRDGLVGGLGATWLLDLIGFPRARHRPVDRVHQYR